MGGADGGKKILTMPLGIFVAVPPVLVNGDRANLRVDSDAILLVRNVGPLAVVTAFDTGADVASAIIKAAAGNIFSITAHNSNAAIRFLHIFDLVAVPAPGTAPDWVAPPVGPSENVSFFFGELGLPFGTGITIAVSTTRTTFTAAGADMWISARFG